VWCFEWSEVRTEGDARRRVGDSRHRTRDTSEAPTGEDILYHCLACDATLRSRPVYYVRCHCGNIHIDIGYFRLSLRDFGRSRQYGAGRECQRARDEDHHFAK